MTLLFRFGNGTHLLKRSKSFSSLKYKLNQKLSEKQKTKLVNFIWRLHPYNHILSSHGVMALTIGVVFIGFYEFYTYRISPNSIPEALKETNRRINSHTDLRRRLGLSTRDTLRIFHSLDDLDAYLENDCAFRKDKSSLPASLGGENSTLGIQFDVYALGENNKFAKVRSDYEVRHDKLLEIRLLTAVVFSVNDINKDNRKIIGHEMDLLSDD